VVAFAPQLSKEPLGDAVPQDVTWTHSGKHAGLLRLVPLRESAISIHWADDAAHREAPGDEPDGQQTEPAAERWS
jgi:hypothetical protein